MITAKQIAERLGVAVSTVGRALADDPRISQATKERVRVAATKAGYVGSVPARIMRGASSRLIGLIVPNVLNDFYATIAQELSTCCEAAGFQLALSIANDDQHSEFKQIQKFVAARVAGIVLVPTSAPLPETVKLLAPIPHVQLLRRSPALRADWFGIEDDAAIAMSTRLLIDDGHRRIAYVGAFEELPTGRARLAGYRRAMSAAGIAFSAARVRLGPPTADFGQAATETLLAHKRRPTALVCGSVPITLGALFALRAARVRVPAELSLVGFGDPPWFELWGPGLTTVQLPIDELAQACGTYLLQRLADSGGARSTSAKVAVARRATLVIRGSTRAIT